MRRVTSPPYCYLETVKPVRHKAYNKKLKYVTVFRRYRFHGWYQAHTLEELIQKFAEEIKSHGWKSDPHKGTVNGIPMRLVRSDTYQDEYLTAKELAQGGIRIPAGYTHYRVNLKARTVTLLCMFVHDIERMQKNPCLWRRIESDPRYLKPMTVPLPSGWVVTYYKNTEKDGTVSKTPNVSGFLWDRNRDKNLDFADCFAKLSDHLTGKANWEIENAFGWPTMEELVERVFSRRAARGIKGRPFWEITGLTFEDKDSPKVLYRAMHYFKATKLDELYKGHLVRLHHPQGIAFADIGTWKCEMEIRLYADKERCTQKKPCSPVRAGAPGSHSDEVEAPEEVMAWYHLLLKLLRAKAMIYSGNDFEV